FLVFLAGGAQMHVQVDEAGAEQRALQVDHLLRRGGETGTERGDVVAIDQQIAVIRGAQFTGRVDQRAVFQEEFHGDPAVFASTSSTPRPSRSRNTAARQTTPPSTCARMRER